MKSTSEVQERLNAQSSSTRGTWIEILKIAPRIFEIVGRPPHGGRGLKYTVRKLSDNRIARRPPHGGRGLKYIDSFSEYLDCGSRPPHGGRGLKFWVSFVVTSLAQSSSTRGTWIEIKSQSEKPMFRSVVLHTGDVD